MFFEAWSVLMINHITGKKQEFELRKHMQIFQRVLPELRQTWTATTQSPGSATFTRAQLSSSLLWLSIWMPTNTFFFATAFCSSSTVIVFSFPLINFFQILKTSINSVPSRTVLTTNLASSWTDHFNPCNKKLPFSLKARITTLMPPLDYYKWCQSTDYH